MLKVLFIVYLFCVVRIHSQSRDNDRITPWTTSHNLEDYTADEYDIQHRRPERVPLRNYRHEDSDEDSYHNSQPRLRYDGETKQQSTSLTHKDYEQLLKETHLARLRSINKKNPNQPQSRHVSPTPHVEQYLKEVNPTTSTINVKPTTRTRYTQLPTSQRQRASDSSKTILTRYDLRRIESQEENIPIYQYENFRDTNDDSVKVPQTRSRSKVYQDYQQDNTKAVEQDEPSKSIVLRPPLTKYSLKNYQYDEQNEELPSPISTIYSPPKYSPKNYPQYQLEDAKLELNEEIRKPVIPSQLSRYEGQRKRYNLLQEDVNEPVKPSRNTPFNIVAYQNALLAQQKVLSQIQNQEPLVKRQKTKQRPTSTRKQEHDNNQQKVQYTAQRLLPQEESINIHLATSKYQLPLPLSSEQVSLNNQEEPVKTPSRYDHISALRQLKQAARTRNPTRKSKYDLDEFPENYKVTREQTRYNYDDASDDSEQIHYRNENEQYSNPPKISTRPLIKDTRYESIDESLQYKNQNFRILDRKSYDNSQRQVAEPHISKQYLREVYRPSQNQQYSDLAYQPSTISIRHAIPIRAKIIYRNLGYDETDPNQSEFITAYII